MAVENNRIKIAFDVMLRMCKACGFPPELIVLSLMYYLLRFCKEANIERPDKLFTDLYKRQKS